MSKAKEICRDLENFINGASTEALEEFSEEFGRMHPTLQQKGFGMLLKVVKVMANKPYVDARNEVAKLRATQVINGLKAQMIKELEESDADYWKKNNRAVEFINSNNFDISILPLI